MIRTAILMLTFVVCNAYVVKQPEISLIEPQGLRFAYPDDGAISMVAFHYSINSILTGVNAGQYNVDVTVPQGGYFIHDNTGVQLGPGETVSYWLLVLTTENQGHQLLDQLWVVPYPTTTTQPSATTTTSATTTEPMTTTTAQATNEPPTDPPTAGPTTTTESTGGNGGNGGGVVNECSYPCDSSVCDMNMAPCNGLIFEENWDDFNLDRWQHENTMSGGGNWEFQIYTNNRTNSYVRDNTLFIKPTLTADHYGESFLSSGTVDLWGSTPADFCTANSFWGCMRTGSGSNYINPAKSARIRTVESFNFKYGRVEVEAKMPKGDWLWPAIWMLPKNNAYGTWPASGEIDIIESRGNADLKDSSGVSHGNDAMGATMHWGPYYPVNGYPRTTTEQHDETFASEFHKYTVDWNEESITFYVDDIEILKVDPGEGGFWEFGEFDKEVPGSDNPWINSKNKMAPFDQEFFLILNVAVGGTNGFFPDEWTNGNGAKPWNNASPTAMKDFWEAKNSWYPTWQPDVNDGENAALQVKRIRVWATGH